MPPSRRPASPFDRDLARVLVSTWESINQSTVIEFSGARQVRVFLADFFDVDGNHDKAMVEVRLACSTGNVCDGCCVDIRIDTDHCGGCKQPCDVPCETGGCF